MITREDVAKRAGVSVSAVSRAMNGRGYVAKDKKEAIYKAVEELGYRPNPLSNSLKNRQTYQLCFFGSDIYNSFIKSFLIKCPIMPWIAGIHCSTFLISV